MKIIILVALSLTQIACFLFDSSPRSIDFIDTASYAPPIQDYDITNQLFNKQKVDQFKPKVQRDHFVQHKTKSTHHQLRYQPPVQNENKNLPKDDQTQVQGVKQVGKGSWSLEQIKNTANDNLFLIVFIVGFFSVLFLRSRKQPQTNISIRLPDSEISMSSTIMPNFQPQN